jgi:hypothetical protein
LGDVVKNEYRRYDCGDQHDDDKYNHDKDDTIRLDQEEPFDAVLANPPFIPTPPQVERRYGLFSAGGEDGEVVLAAILQLATQVLVRRHQGFVAIVSEFMNPHDPTLLQRLQEWTRGKLGGILFTNEHPVDAETYAQRRAGSDEDSSQQHSDFDVWRQHLAELGISHVSPGLLFLKPSLSDIVSRVVPKSKMGSIWTPANQEAVEFTQRVVDQELSHAEAKIVCTKYDELDNTEQ